MDEGFFEEIEDGLAATNFGAIGGGGGSSGGVAVAQRSGEIVTRKPAWRKAPMRESPLPMVDLGSIWSGSVSKMPSGQAMIAPWAPLEITTVG
ncbi:hypothetical protein CCB80_15640 [Armatimonadetes bacterium Uphvl-Ar1]|nr:hypothetical protein CCB80_15640 [Armatimonadetes bacterium Uphvl-Ar1]